MDIDYTVAALMFPAIPLMMTMYSNRFHTLSGLIRKLHDQLTFDKKGFVQFEVFEGQESYKIKPFVKSNAWGVFKDGVSVFNKGNLIDVYSASGLNEFLIN